HRLQPRVEPAAVEQIDPSARGSLIHEVQRRVLQALRDEGALPLRVEALPRALERLDAVLADADARYRDTLAPAIPRVWNDGMARIRADLREWLRRATQEARWVPWRFELSFGLGADPDHDPHSQDEPV